MWREERAGERERRRNCNGREIPAVKSGGGERFVGEIWEYKASKRLLEFILLFYNIHHLFIKSYTCTFFSKQCIYIFRKYV